MTVTDRVDWPAFLARHDLVWEELPEVWHAGAFLGNGRLGAMIYAATNDTLHWDVGRSDVTDRGNRLAIGSFTLGAEAAPQRGDLRLDLWNAEARGTVRGRDAAWTWRSFTDAERPVTLIEVAATGGAPPALAFVHSPALPARASYKGEPIPENERNPAPQAGAEGDVRWLVQPFKAGGGYAVAWGGAAAAPGWRLYAFTVDYAAEGAPASAKAAADVRAALAEGAAVAERRHRAWWHAWYPKAFLSVPDTRLESFYWIQMYKLASGTRADAPALDLMGPWFRRTPWPRIWWNLNIQLTYWPVYTANRLDIGESLTRMLDAGAANLASNVPAAWQTDSAAIGRTSSYDCRGSVSGRDGEERGNLTWALHNYWLQYRGSGDEAMLRERLYPLLRRAVGYYLHLLKPGEDGKLHLPVSLSPEYPKTAPDTNYDLALLRWGLQTLLAANERLGLKDPLAPRWKETRDRLAPYPVDPATGYMIGAGVPLAQSHRHFSHLMMIYPLHLVDPTSPADRPMIEKSLDHWIGFEGALQGYSFTGASAMSSWLGRRDAAVRLLNEFLDRFVKPNTMYLEAGPVIETPLAAAAAIHEVVLQSWTMDPFGTDIRVFPAVPDAWADATIHKLLAEGAFEVSAVRRGGKTRWVRLTSLAGNPCRVRTGLEGPVAASGARAFTVGEEQDGRGGRVTTVDLRKGETVLLYPRDAPPGAADLAITPVPAPPGRENYFGSVKTPAAAPDAQGAFLLTAKQARLKGGTFFLQKLAGVENVGHWTDARDELVWKIEAPAAGAYRVLATYAATGEGTPLTVRLARRGGEPAGRVGAARRGTGGWDVFKEFDLGTLTIPAAGAWEVICGSGDGAPPLVNLQQIRLTPVAKPSPPAAP